MSAESDENHGCWRLAQSPDHRTYYYHTGRKLTKWLLDPSEREELLRDLKAHFKNKEGLLDENIRVVKTLVGMARIFRNGQTFFEMLSFSEISDFL